MNMQDLDQDSLDIEVPETLKIPYLGLHSIGMFSTSTFRKYFPITMCLILSATLDVIALAQFTNLKKDVSDYVSNLEEIFAFSLVFGKVISITYRSNELMGLIKQTKSFWSIDKCSQHVQVELHSIRRMIIRLQKIFGLVLVITVGLYTTLALIQKTHILGVWTLKGHQQLYVFKIILQPVAVLISAILIFCLDGMYLGFCAEIVIQFRIMRQCFEELITCDGNHEEMEINNLKKMKISIQHHGSILHFVKSFRETFSLMLLVQYVAVCPLICAELYAGLESDSNNNQIKHVGSFVFYTMQLCFYCIPSNYISNEALAVSDAVYFSNWYSQYFPSLKMPLLFMIQNSQKEISIKAGDLITLNAGAVVNVLKIAWSACSIIRGIRHD